MKFSATNSDNLMDNLPEAVVLTDIDGKILDANDKACKFLGFEKEDLLELKLEEFVSEDSPTFSLDRIFEEENDAEFSRTINIDKKGKKIPVELKGSKVEIEGEERVLVSIRVITDRKTTGTEQEQKEIRGNKGHQYYFNKMGDAVFITGVGGEDTGKILDVNTAAVEQTGYSREELLGMNIGEDLSINPPEMGFEEMDEKLANDETITFTEKKRRKNGTEYWTEVIVTPIDYQGEKASLSINRDITKRKEIEKQLEQYKLAIEGSENLIAACDENYDYIFANQPYRELSGIGEEEIVGMNVRDLVEDNRFETTIKPQLDRCLNGERIEFECKRNHPELGERYMLTSYYPLKRDNDIQGVVGVLRDITERKQMERKLKENERKFRNYVENAPLGIFLIDEQGAFLEVNEAGIELTGYSKEELLQMSFQEILTPEGEDGTFDAFKELVKKGETKAETSYTRKDGTERQVVVNAVEISRHRYLAFTLDVTKRREAERKLEQSKERLEAAMESGNLAWWRMELPSGKVSFSDLKTEMLGYSPERFEHYEDFTELIHPEDYDRAMNAMRSHLNGEEDKYEVEYRIKKKTGDYKWFRDVGSMAKEENERKVVTGVVIDIDERKEAELALNDERSKLKKLHDAVDQFQQCESEEGLFSVAVQATKNILEFDYCIFYRAENEKLVPVAVTEDMKLEDLVSLKQDEGLAGKTFQKKSSILGDNLQKEDRAISNRSDIKGYLSVPIGDIGVFQAGTAKIGAFDEGDLELAEILAGHLNEEVKRISLEEELQQQAIRDPLTGLYNRRYFNEILKKETQESERYNKPLAFLMIDVNKFKKINDRYSHQTGDKILEEVANLLKENFRDADTVVRYGGDEFLVMMPETEDEVTNAVNRLNQELERWNSQSDLLDSPLVLAIGVSHWTPDQDRHVVRALKEADKKMYEDKNRKN